MAKVPVSSVTNLHTTAVGPTSVSLAWKPPARGTPPIRYSVFFRVKGSPTWRIGVSNIRQTSAVVTKLLPATRYEFEVFCQNT